MNSLSNNYQSQFLALPTPHPESGDYTFTTDNAVVAGEILDWDSDVIGVKSARIHTLWCSSASYLDELKILLDRCLAQMDSDGVDFIDLRIGLHCLPMIQMAEQNGFFMTDALNVYLSKSAPELKELPDDVTLFTGRLTESSDIEAVLDISRNLFTYSRMYQDRSISKTTADAFYASLVKHFMMKDDTLFTVAYKDNVPVGFYIGMEDSDISITDSLGYLWLIGIAQAYAGHGLGQLLLNHFLVNMHKRCDVVEIGTQVNNSAANRIYQKAQIPLLGNLVTLHRWKK